jgi:demethylmenaquinone methyltransferase/2-methoxy-6-polyprenyl-1,4-benzoquinol methylase
MEFAVLMKEAGFTHIRFKQMTFGIVTLFTGVKPGKK